MTRWSLCRPATASGQAASCTTALPSTRCCATRSRPTVPSVARPPSQRPCERRPHAARRIRAYSYSSAL
eukprot:848073-Alexandrium_andersonii.AAC.1